MNAENDIILRLRSTTSTPAPEIRLKRLLKLAGRYFDFRAIAIEPAPRAADASENAPLSESIADSRRDCAPVRVARRPIEEISPAPASSGRRTA